MDPSIVLSRCVQRLSTRSSTLCLRTTSHKHVHLNSTRCSSRAFSSTHHAAQDVPPESRSKPSNTHSEAYNSSNPPQQQVLEAQADKQASRPQSSSGRSYSRGEPKDSRRIDLSSIPGIGKDYVPPKPRSQSRTTAESDAQTTPQTAQNTRIRAARDQLDAMLKANQDRLQQQQQQRPGTSPSSLPRKVSDSDPLSFVPGAGPPSRSKPFTGSPADSYSILDEFTRPTRPANKSSSSSSIYPTPFFAAASRENTTASIALRLRPTLGRTQIVKPEANLDLTRAFRLMESKCTQNSVRKDEIKQKFHVRRGQRRKLERSARWRVVFKAGFLEECARVRRMMKQGW